MRAWRSIWRKSGRSRENLDPADISTNTMVALEKAGQLFIRVMLVFNARHRGESESCAGEGRRRLKRPVLAAHHDAIFLNSKLFQP